MIGQRSTNLNPSAKRKEAVKITYPPNHSRRSGWVIEPMRFIPHAGRAKEPVLRPAVEGRIDRCPGTWCQQCEQRVHPDKARGCQSAWCKAKIDLLEQETGG